MATAKPKTVAVAANVALVVGAQTLTMAPAANAMETSHASSPPRYLLNRVFRI
jgi:hypothetical protein